MFKDKEIEFTCAFSGCRHVAKICLIGLLELSSCLIMPNPSPRLQPVMRIEFIVFIQQQIEIDLFRCCRQNWNVLT